MRVILVWPTPSPDIRIIHDALVQAGHAIAYWVGERPTAHLCPEGAVFHDHYDAWDGKPADAFAKAGFPSPSLSLIGRMYQTESSVLTMMNKRYDTAPVDERKQIYYSMLGYWSGVLDATRADVVVFGTLPHTVYNYVIHDLARLKGIPTICFEDTWVALRLLMYRDFWEGNRELQRSVARLRKRRVALGELGAELRAYYAKHAVENQGDAPSYMLDQRRVAEGFGLLAHRARIALGAARNGSIFPLAVRYLSRLWKKDLKDEYRALEKKPNLRAPFVYFPLSFQPERTTSPQGGIYHDQILVARTLADALPEGWRLYVKEHPSQWWLRGKTRYSSARYPGYYERLARIPNTALVPPETNSFTLLTHAHAVATVTGTAGWEALLAGKTPLVFGIPWYRDCPGVFRVRSVESCRSAFEAIRQNARVGRDDVLAYLKALEENTIRAHVGDPPADSPRLTPEENAGVLSAAVCTALAAIKK